VSAAERRALNEKVFREMNERVERLGEEFGDDAVEFLCECADPACSTPLSIQVYETVRDHPRWFVVVPGHEREGVERVVQEHPGCLVIEKVGEAGEVAEDRAPSSRRSHARNATTASLRTNNPDHSAEGRESRFPSVRVAIRIRPPLCEQVVHAKPRAVDSERPPQARGLAR
jgi:hypothetical protein